MEIDILSHEENKDKKIRFDYIVKFKMSSIMDHERGCEKNLKDVCTWCANTFKENFIIIEHAAARIAGGYSDNAAGWKADSKKMRKDYAWQSKYELRCMSQDAAWFKMRFG